VSAADVAVEAHELLDAKGIRHAFGGALALNYYAQPRLTMDVDINIAVPVEDADEVIDAFVEQAFELESPLVEERAPVAGTRLRRNRDILDLFFAFDDFHAKVVRNARIFPFSAGGEVVELPFLSADDLVVMKMSSNRAKDWVDIEAMLASGTPVDADYSSRELVGFRGPTMHPRTAVLRQLVRRMREEAR
jgi:hypothetical protein